MLGQKPSSGRSPRFPSLVKIFLSFGGFLSLVGLAVWWAHGFSAVKPLVRGDVPQKLAQVGYIGSRSCGECHPGESASFSRSGHALTLRPADKVPLAHKLDGKVVADPELPHVRWTYTRQNGQLRVTRISANGNSEQFVLDYAFGSDHHATTFVSLAESKWMPATEHRLTHYSRDDIFRVTPGQSAAKPYPGTNPHGRELPDWETRACFQCHATLISAAGPDLLKLDEMIPNVSCERCHGPAASHVAAARAGETASSILSMPFGPDQWTAETQMALCGKCHRHPSEALPGRLRPEIPALARFQPIGILQSKCFQASNGTLSCVNCHDPHARSSADRSLYVAACLQCHGAESQTHCSVSPKSDCIGCHMPLVDTGQRVLFTDHWIRVRNASDPPAEK